MAREEGTYTDGLRALGVLLARRTAFAVVLWLIPVYFAIQPLTHLPNSTILTVLFTVPLGILTGAPLGYRLLSRTQLVGWVPTLAAFGVAALIVVGGSALVHGLRPYSSDFFRTLVPVLGLIGAGAAIAKLTLAES